MTHKTPEKSSQTNTDALKRDSRYFLDVVVFQVEDRLFKVPKYYFVQESDIFETMFSVPQPEGDLEGSSENKPLLLPGINKGEFRMLLEVMYPFPSVGVKTLHDTMTQEGWISVLKLATMWEFKHIRGLAIDKLTKEYVEPTERILLARTYGVPQWLREGYNALAARDGVVTLEEARRIGCETAILLFHVKERVRGRSPAGYGDSNSEDSNSERCAAIECIFEKELREVSMQ